MVTQTYTQCINTLYIIYTFLQHNILQKIADKKVYTVPDFTFRLYTYMNIHLRELCMVLESVRWCIFRHCAVSSDTHVYILVVYRKYRKKSNFHFSKFSLMLQPFSNIWRPHLRIILDCGQIWTFYVNLHQHPIHFHLPP